MRTPIVTASLLATLLLVGLAPAASASDASAEVDVRGNTTTVEAENSSLTCPGTPSASTDDVPLVILRPSAYSGGDCDVHVSYY